MEPKFYHHVTHTKNSAIFFFAGFFEIKITKIRNHLDRMDKDSPHNKEVQSESQDLKQTRLKIKLGIWEYFRSFLSSCYGKLLFTPGFRTFSRFHAKVVLSFSISNCETHCDYAVKYKWQKNDPVRFTHGNTPLHTQGNGKTRSIE